MLSFCQSLKLGVRIMFRVLHIQNDKPTVLKQTELKTSVLFPSKLPLEFCFELTSNSKCEGNIVNFKTETRLRPSLAPKQGKYSSKKKHSLHVFALRDVPGLLRDAPGAIFTLSPLLARRACTVARRACTGRPTARQIDPTGHPRFSCATC